MYHEPSVQFRKCVWERDVDAAREYLEQGVNVDVRGLGGYTALADAAFHGDRAMLALLLEFGAVIDALDGEHHTTALFKALRCDHIEAARFLIERGADVSTGRFDSDSPVLTAIVENRPDWLQLLLEGGVDANHDATFVRPLLMEAAERGHAEIVGLLLDHGANPNFMGSWDRTALQLAVPRGHVEVVRVLVEKGADVNAGAGRKPLEIADEVGFSEIATLLRSASDAG